MLEDGHPIVTVNEDYVDLRASGNLESKNNLTTENKPTPYTSQLKSEGLHEEKELVNFGLKKLVTRFYEVNSRFSLNHRPSVKYKSKSNDPSRYDPRFRRRVSPSERRCLSSKSEVSLCPNKVTVNRISPSTPALQSIISEGSQAESSPRRQDKATMTPMLDRKGNFVDGILHPVNSSIFLRDSSRFTQEFIWSKPFLEKDYFTQPQWRNPRLLRKYSILKVPWKRAWTVPVFTSKSSLGKSNFKQPDTLGCETYKYDDGTDAESRLLILLNSSPPSRVTSKWMSPLLLFGGCLCGLLIVSLIVWFVFGNELLLLFFQPKKPEESTIVLYVKKYLKWIGGGIIYLITNTIRGLGTILLVPSSRVIQVPEEVRWVNYYEQQ